MDAFLSVVPNSPIHGTSHCSDERNQPELILANKGQTFNDLIKAKPNIGTIYHFYIPISTTSKLTKGPYGNKIFGTGIYTPTSEIFLICLHVGCLTLHNKSKRAGHNEYSTIQNCLEIQCQEGDEYHKHSLPIVLPPEHEIKGVAISICIDNPPSAFTGTKRNSVSSKDSNERFSFSLRVVDYSILYFYDQDPKIIDGEQFTPDSAAVPVFIKDSNDEDMIKFTPTIFRSIVSLENAIDLLFLEYHVIIVANGERYAIKCDSELNVSISRTGHDRKHNLGHGEKLAEGPFPSLTASSNKIQLGEFSLENIDGIILDHIHKAKVSRKH